MPSFPPGVHLKGGRNAAPVLAALAAEFYAPIIPVVTELRQQGLSLRTIARELEKRWIMPRRGSRRWSAAQIRRLLLRAGHGAAPEVEPPADIELWVDMKRLGPFTQDQVKELLHAQQVTLETLYVRPGMGFWRALRELARA